MPENFPFGLLYLIVSCVVAGKIDGEWLGEDDGGGVVEDGGGVVDEGGGVVDEGGGVVEDPGGVPVAEPVAEPLALLVGVGVGQFSCGGGSGSSVQRGFGGCRGADGAALLAMALIRGVSAASIAPHTIKATLACFLARLRPSSSRGI